VISTHAFRNHRGWLSVGKAIFFRSYLQKKAFTAIILLSLYSCAGDQVVPDDVPNGSGNSAYITKVFDYQYAPGQHASLIPATAKGDEFTGVPWSNGKSFISLGGWGGYIVAGFDHPVSNATGPDLALFTQPSVSSEPGIVYVMADQNQDGQPNDGPWYEIKGSEFENAETIHNYQVTYYKPGPSGYIEWKDNKGKSGTLVPGYQADNWWWSGYGDKSSITFSGVRLPDAYVNTSGTPGVELWMVRTGLFASGYAECYGNNDYNSSLKANLFDISLAVDPSGKPAGLGQISFIKVQSSVFQVAGWLNEISTEISGAADLHLLDKKSF
jgi:hypothetical protein